MTMFATFRAIVFIKISIIAKYLGTRVKSQNIETKALTVVIIFCISTFFEQTC